MDPEYLKKLVVERLRTMPPNMKLSIGEYGSFDKNQLIAEVEKETDVGKETVESQLTLILESPYIVTRLRQ